ncbi:MAG: hypothetical protein KDA52_24910, partial [Planctomycetaceae bacterium]|nr:hypothetical protein [Planctomycetaceae bacterium]
MLTSVPNHVELRSATASLDENLSQRSHGVSDRELFELFLLEQKEDTFGELVSRFGAMVFAVAMRCLRDCHAAEDVF